MERAPETSQAMQRVKVGLTGLLAVLALIALASVIIGQASRERPVAAIGAPKPDVVANMTIDNGASPVTEPLAELGVAPSANAQAPATTQ